MCLGDTLIKSKATLYKCWLTSEHLQAFECFRVQKKEKRKQNPLQSAPLSASKVPQKPKSYHVLTEDCSPSPCMKSQDIRFQQFTEVQFSYLVFLLLLFLCISLTSPSLSCAERPRWRQRVLPSWRRRWHSMGRLRGWSVHTECAAGDARIPAIKEQKCKWTHCTLEHVC